MFYRCHCYLNHLEVYSYVFEEKQAPTGKPESTGSNTEGANSAHMTSKIKPTALRGRPDLWL